MVFIPRKADAFFAALDHVGHRILDLNAVFHIKAVSFKRRTHIHHRAVYKQQRKIQIAQHLCVVIVEYFKADDADCALDVERRWKFFLFQLYGRNAMNGHAAVQMVDFRLETIQHRGGKVRAAQKLGRQHGDLPFVTRQNERLCCFCSVFLKQRQIGELLIAHFGGFAQDLLPCGICQHTGVVDGL